MLNKKTTKNEPEDEYKIDFDADDDGLTDFEEENIYFTDPHNPDTDGDGMSDGDEVKAGRNPNGPGMLVDFFVPNKSNDYHPHSLHPRRLLLHGAAAILMKLLIVVFVVIFPIEAWLTPEVLFEQAKKIIDLTNVLRQEKKIQILRENSALDQAAFAKAQDMLVGQYFEHISPTNIGLAHWLHQTNYDYAVAGENLAMGFADADDVEAAWIKSKTHYSNLIDPDFSEIGVGIVSGPFEKQETTLVAQFFGTTKLAKAAQAQPVVSKTTIIHTLTPLPVNKTLTIAKPAVTVGTVAGTEIKSATPKIVTLVAPPAPPADLTSPEVDLTRTKLIMDSSEGTDKMIIRAQAFLSADTKESEVTFGNTVIPLERDGQDINKWTGSQIVFKDPNIDAPTVLPVLSAVDYSGNAGRTDIRIENLVPNKLNPLDQYLFLKNHQSKAMAGLFNVSSFYFKGLLIFLIFSLLINVFIEIKRQHPHIIFSTIGLMGLLLLFIAF